MEPFGQANCNPAGFAGRFAGRQNDVRPGEHIDGAEEIDPVLADVGVALGFVPLEIE